MGYGPGRSFKVWEEYFTHPNASLNYMEVDGKCVEKMNIQPRNGRVFIGSQDNPAFLEEVAKQVAEFGGLDVLVDDGGHRMNQQLLTTQILWPHIRPGGLLVMEDVHTSYRSEYGGTLDAPSRAEHTSAAPTTFLGKVNELIDTLNCDYSEEECDQELQAVHCYHHACVLRKAQQESDHVDLQKTGGEYMYPNLYIQRSKG